MKAFIPYTASFSSMAQEAGRRLSDYAGVTGVDYVKCKSKEDCHRAKIAILLDYSEPVVLADSDWWMVRKVSLPIPSGTFVYGTPNDFGTEEGYSGTIVPPRSALCSALLGIDMGNEACREAIQCAIRLQKRDYSKDEVYLNLALFSQPELCVARLSNHWNWCGPPTKEAIAIHAAGRENKLEWLLEHSERRP